MLDRALTRRHSRDRGAMNASTFAGSLIPGADSTPEATSTPTAARRRCPRRRSRASARRTGSAAPASGAGPPAPSPTCGRCRRRPCRRPRRAGGSRCGSARRRGCRRPSRRRSALMTRAPVRSATAVQNDGPSSPCSCTCVSPTPSASWTTSSSVGLTNTPTGSTRRRSARAIPAAIAGSQRRLEPGQKLKPIAHAPSVGRQLGVLVTGDAADLHVGPVAAGSSRGLMAGLSPSDPQPVAGRSASCTVDVAARCRRAARASSTDSPGVVAVDLAQQVGERAHRVAVDRLDDVVDLDARRGRPGRPRSTSVDLHAAVGGGAAEPDVRPDDLAAVLELGAATSRAVFDRHGEPRCSPPSTQRGDADDAPVGRRAAGRRSGRLDHRVGLRARRRSGSRRAPRRCWPAAAIRPVPAVARRPVGLPTAITWSPGRDRSESPSSSGRRSSPLGVDREHREVGLLVLAEHVRRHGRPSGERDLTAVTPLTTCALVRTRPSPSSTKPEPVETRSSPPVVGVERRRAGLHGAGADVDDARRRAVVDLARLSALAGAERRAGPARRPSGAGPRRSRATIAAAVTPPPSSGGDQRDCDLSACHDPPRVAAER